MNKWQELKEQIQHEISEAEIGRQLYSTEFYAPAARAMTVQLITDIKINTLQRVCKIMERLEET
jgi:hypothetical protein